MSVLIGMLRCLVILVYDVMFGVVIFVVLFVGFVVGVLSLVVVFLMLVV